MKRTVLMAVLALLIAPGLLLAQAEVATEKKQEKGSAVTEWVELLAKQLGNENATIKNSASRAIAAVGKEAIPTLQKVAKSDDAAIAKAAKDIITRIERGGQRGRRRGGEGGFGGRRRGGEGREGGRRRRGGRGRFGMGRVDVEALGLNDDQKKKFETLQSKQREEMQDLMEQVRSGEIPREEIREVLSELRESMKKKMKGILTEEQFKKYEESTQRRRGRGRGRGRGDG